jgi:hypothetical protein
VDLEDFRQYTFHLLSRKAQKQKGDNSLYVIMKNVEAVKVELMISITGVVGE